MIADPITARHLQPYRHSPHVLDVKRVALRIQDLIQPTRREPVRRLIPPRRARLLLPVRPRVLPSVQQPVLLRERGVRWRNRVHVSPHDPAHHPARLLQHLPDHAHLRHAHRRAHGERLEVRVDHTQDPRAVLRRRAPAASSAQRYIRHQRAPPHPALLKVDARRIYQRRVDQRDRPVRRAFWPARLRAARHDPEPLPDPRMCE